MWLCYYEQVKLSSLKFIIIKFMSWILMLKHATISSGIISSFQGVLVLYQRELLKLSSGMCSPKLLWRYSLEGLFNQRRTCRWHLFANYPKLPQSLLVDVAWCDFCRMFACCCCFCVCWAKKVLEWVCVLTVVMNYQLKCQPGGSAMRKNIVRGFN